MKIHIESKFLAHEGGTKFYEVVEFWNTEQSKYVVVKRWGANGSVGQKSIEAFSVLRKAQQHADKTISSKVSRGYEITPSSYGLHGIGASEVSVDDGAINRLVRDHYGSGEEILEELGLFEREIDPDEGEIVYEEPEPEPERGEEWGSW